jgi:membrane-associated phospholipid phosphatase
VSPSGRLPLPPGVDSFDRWVEARWDRFRGTSVVDRALYTASEMGDFGMIWMLAAAVPALTGRPRAGRQLYRLAGALAVENLIVNQGLKRLFRRERPSWDQARPHELRKPITSSFPSGHSTSAMTAAILLSETKVLPRPLIGIAVAAVAASRVHVKIHHPSDVVGGLTVGFFCGWAIRRFFPVG